MPLTRPRVSPMRAAQWAREAQRSPRSSFEITREAILPYRVKPSNGLTAGLPRVADYLPPRRQYAPEPFAAAMRQARTLASLTAAADKIAAAWGARRG